MLEATWRLMSSPSSQSCGNSFHTSLYDSPVDGWSTREALISQWAHLFHGVAQPLGQSIFSIWCTLVINSKEMAIYLSATNSTNLTLIVKDNAYAPVTLDLIGRKYVPPKLPACKTSLGVRFGLNLGWSENSSVPSFLLVTSSVSWEQSLLCFALGTVPNSSFDFLLVPFFSAPWESFLFGMLPEIQTEGTRHNKGHKTKHTLYVVRNA